VVALAVVVVVAGEEKLDEVADVFAARGEDGVHEGASGLLAGFAGPPVEAVALGGVAVPRRTLLPVPQNVEGLERHADVLHVGRVGRDVVATHWEPDVVQAVARGRVRGDVRVALESVRFDPIVACVVGILAVAAFAQAERVLALGRAFDSVASVAAPNVFGAAKGRFEVEKMLVEPDFDGRLHGDVVERVGD